MSGGRPIELHISSKWEPASDWQDQNEFDGKFPANNLEEMETWWNGWSHPRSAAVIVKLFPTCHLDPGHSNARYTEYCGLSVEKDDASNETLDMVGEFSIYGDKQCNGNGERMGGYSLFSAKRTADGDIVEANASYIIIPIGQRVLAKGVGASPVGSNVAPGDLSFKAIFSDLAEASKGLEVLSLEKLESRLSEEVARGSDNLEAFGLKLPAELVTNWGTLLLICGQLYLIVYLRQLSGRLTNNDDGWNVPWMALEDSWLGQSMFAASLAVVPVAIALLRYHALYPTIKSHPTWPDYLVFAAVSLLSAALALASWRYRPLKNEELALALAQGEENAGAHSAGSIAN